MVGMATVIYGLLWYHYGRENRRCADGFVSPKHENLSEEQLAELGDESPHYRYTVLLAATQVLLPPALFFFS